MLYAFEKNDAEREGMNEEEKIALFDAFLRNEMSDSDKSDFTALLDKSEEFKNDFESYQNDNDVYFVIENKGKCAYYEYWYRNFNNFIDTYKILHYGGKTPYLIFIVFP